MKTSCPKLFVMLIALCFAISCAHAGEKTPLNIYTARETPTLDVVIPQFEAAYPQYDVEVLTLPSQQVLERVRAEHTNPHGDIWWGGTIQQFIQAANEGLLESYQPTFSDKINAAHRGPDHRWYGDIQLPEVIMYNTDALTPEEAPQDWEDLLDPKWKNLIAIRGVLPSGTMRTIYCSLIYRQDPKDIEKGFDWLRKLDANTKAYTNNPTNLYLALARQEALVSVWNLMDIISQRDVNDQPFGYIMPKSGAPVLIDGIALIKGAKNTGAAQDFYEFLFSEDIKVQLAEQCGQIPTLPLPESRTPEWIKTLGLKEMQLDWSVLAEKEMEWMEYWDQNIKGQNK